MKWPFLPLWLLFSHSGILGALQRGCKFPEQWRGEWFQSGVPQLVAVNETTITSKGRCIEAEGDKFLIEDRTFDCYRCMVIHEKHPNVLQFKETFCIMAENLNSACAGLAGDAALNSLFRSGAAPSRCPFEGPLLFSYNRGQGECSNPPSLAETCTHESRLLLRYQACHDVPATESIVEELECLAIWREGSTRYLVARLSAERLTTDEDRYRCFVYAKSGKNSWNLAQSGDATCSGLLSATEGARTLNMTQSHSPDGCDFPNWLVSAGTWVALDLVARLLTSPRNLTILDQDETRLFCHALVSSDHQIQSSITQGQRRVTLVAKATRGCKNGYVCLIFHKRDGHVIEMQQSEVWSQQAEDACQIGGFNPLSAPYTTFITLDPKTKQCPHLGSYKVASWRSYHSVEGAKEMVGFDGEHILDGNEGDAVAQEVRITPLPPPSTTPCHQDSVTGLDMGCRSSHRIEFSASCTDEAFSVYWCHGSWEENGTAYVVASTETARYCLIYSAAAASGSSNDLSVTNHFASCPRPTHPHRRQHSWKVNLTAYAQCGEASSSSSWRICWRGAILSRIIICALFSRYVTR